MRLGADMPFGDINPVAAIFDASPFGRFIMLCCILVLVNLVRRVVHPA